MIITNKIKKDILFIILLALPFSYLGSAYALNFSGKFIPEILLIPWIFIVSYYGRGDFYGLKSTLKSRSLLLAFGLMAFCALFGVLASDFDPMVFYARLRALVVFIFGYFYVQKMVESGRKEELRKFLLSLCIGIIFFNLIYSILLTDKYSDEVVGAVAKSPFVALAYCIIISIFLSENKLFPAALFFLLLLVSSILSFYRQNYLITLLTAVYIIIFSIFCRGNNARIYGSQALAGLGFLLAFLLVLFFLYQLSFDYVSGFFESSEARYIQSIGKVNDAISFFNGSYVAESEKTRFDTIYFLLKNFPYFIFPNGLVNDGVYGFKSIWGGSYFNAVEVSVVRDSMIAYFIVTFGYIVVVPVFSLFLMRTISYFTGRESINNKIAVSMLLTFLIIFLFIDGSALTHFEKALITGFCISIAFPKKSSIFN